MPKKNKDLIKSCFREATGQVNPLAAESDIGRFIVETLDACDKIGISKFNLSPNQIGRCRGDWFELCMENVLQHFLRPGEFKVYPGRGHKISEMKNFEKVTWIPMPDAIVKSPTDLRAVLSLKWGMRHDRMYEVGYEAYAIKDWCQKRDIHEPKILLVTNDNYSGYESRLKTMNRVPAIDGVFYVNQPLLSGKLKRVIKSMPELIIQLRQIAEE